MGLTGYEARLEPTHPLQITDSDGRPGVELVGVVVDGSRFRLIHTRRLRTDDIIHELLHVLCPTWPHSDVEAWTDLLVSDPSLCDLLIETLVPETEIQYEPTPSTRRNRSMPEIQAFNLRTRTACTITNPELVTLKNGRPAVRGVASDDGVTIVMRILNAKAAEALAKS